MRSDRSYQGGVSLSNFKPDNIYALKEVPFGSDIFSLKTQAVRDGSAYLLTGAKSYVTNGPMADAIVVYASTNPAYGYLGVTAFVVEKNTPGFSIGTPFRKMGLTTAPVSSVSLEGCRVPEANRLGAEGQGGQIFQRSMQWERSCLFAAYVGLMERQLEQTLAHVRSRHPYGGSIGKKQAIPHRIAEMKMRLENARLLLYRACQLFDQNEDALLEVSLAKLTISESAVRSGLDAIQIHGGVDFAPPSDIERMLRDAIPSTIFSGTSEIQRDLIARELNL